MSEEQVPPTPPSPPPPPPSSAPPPPPASGKVSENRTIMIILAYLGPLALFPFLLEKDDQEVQWHSKHGLVLCAAEIALWIVLGVADVIMTAIFPPLGCIFIIFFLVLGAGLLVFHIMCMVKGNQGERLKVPTLSDLADKF